jgi:ABC-type ATPase with predicted acetyltransferase domain
MTHLKSYHCKLMLSCHCEERSDEAISKRIDCHAGLRPARNDKTSIKYQVTGIEDQPMAEYRIKKTFARHSELSDKCIAVMRMFGLTKERLSRIDFYCDCTISIEPGDIIYITGPSGSGKTVILNELQKAIPARQQIDLAKIRIPKNGAVVDCIEAELLETLRYFSTAGLADCPALLNTPVNLSEGQQWRFRLALALHRMAKPIASGKQFIFADEFCSLLDRITAACISHSIRKFADKYKTTFILASAHQDILRDLLADVIVTRDLSGNTNVTYKLSARERKTKCRPAL